MVFMSHPPSSQPPKNPQKQLCSECKTDKYTFEYIPQYDIYAITCVNGHTKQARITMINPQNKKYR